MQKVGIVGLGLMGSRMAERILGGGYSLTVWNRTPEKAKPLLEIGAKWANSPKELAEGSDVVITMVTDSKAVLEVTAGKEGLLEGAHPGLVLVDMSSIEPTTARTVASLAAERGVGMLDAPVVGSTPQAEQGTLGILVGGEAKDLETARPVLGTLGNKILHCGPNGSGITVKLINQLVFAVVLEVNAEALVLAAKAGVDPKLVMEVLGAGGARTVAMETRGPWILNRDFAPRFSLANQYKDLTNSLAMASDLGVAVPAGAVVHEVYGAAKAQGKGNLDSSAVITVLEHLAQARVGKGED